MDCNRERPDPQLEQQRELERQQEKSLHIEKYTPQVMQQLDQELTNRPELAHIIGKLPDEQQQLKDQITEAAFKGCGPNLPKIDAIY